MMAKQRIFCLFLTLFTAVISGEELRWNQYEWGKKLAVREESENTECMRQIDRFNADLEQSKMWTLKMIDACSKLPSGVLAGNVVDFGNFDECININERNISVLGKYCFGGLTVKLPNSIPLTLALCIPDQCKPSDFQAGLSSVALEDGICQTKDTGSELDWGDIAVIIFLLTVLQFLILSTIYDVYLDRLRKKPFHIILIAFSVYSNGKKLFATSNDPRQLHCLNGLRVFSIFWVILGHRYAMMEKRPQINALEMLNYREQLYTQYVQGAPVAVDTFMFLTGVLISYSLLRPLGAIKESWDSWSGSRVASNSFDLVKTTLVSYVHRYIRLTPALAVLYLIHITVIRHMGSGPLYHYLYDRQRTTCLNQVWPFFLYYQNYDWTKICFLHSWYLSMDMQLFVVSPLVMWPLVFFRKFMMKIGLPVMITASIICPLIITYVYETQMFTQDYYDYYYYVTHTRMAPWLIGIYLGVYILENRDSEFAIHRGVNLGIWGLTLAGMLGIVLFQHDVANNYERIKSSLFITLHRPLWAVGLCWIVWASLKGYGGVVNWILSLSSLQVWSRLTYCAYLIHFQLIVYSVVNWLLSWPSLQVWGRLTFAAYLVHFAVLYYSFGRLRTVSYNSDFEGLYALGGDIMFTFGIALVWTLAFESPVIIIEKVIFGLENVKKPERQETQEPEAIAASNGKEN